MESRVGRDPSKPLQYIAYRTKRVRISKTGSEHKGLFSNIPVNSIALSRSSCSEGLTCFQETLKVSQPRIQHKASLRSPCHTCPTYQGQGLLPEGLFPQPFTTFRSRTETGISVCAQPYSITLHYPITRFPEGPFAIHPEVSQVHVLL